MAIEYLTHYRNHLSERGYSPAERATNIARQRFLESFENTANYRTVMIDGNEQDILLLKSDDFYTKKIISLPGEKLYPGSVITMYDQDNEESKWLTTQVDFDDTLYMSAYAERCNHVLKWRNANNELVERDCIVSDGTKYMSGEQYKSTMSTGNSRMVLMIPHDTETVNLGRGIRFLLDNSSNAPLCFEITKPNRIANVYNGHGIYKYILSECARASEDVDDYINKITGDYDYSNVVPAKNGEWL